METQTLLAELKRLSTANEEAELESLLKRVTYRANISYDEQRRRRTISLRVSIVLLTVAELIALVGVLSPGQPYRGLFVLAAGLATASIVNVAGGALADLGAREGERPSRAG